QALFSYTEQFDGAKLDHLLVTEEEFAEAHKKVSPEFLTAIKIAHKRIKNFHKNQAEKSWFVNEEGVLLGQKVGPIASVGIYVPGGKAAYPSSVLMNAVPAKIAGVPKISITTPPQSDGTINPYVLVAAAEA